MDKKNQLSVWLISKYASPPQFGFGSRLFFIAENFSKRLKNVILFSSDSNHLSPYYPKTKKIYNFESYGNLNHIWIRTLKYKRSNSLRRLLSWLDFELKIFFLPKKNLPKPDVVIVSSLSIFTILYGYTLKKKYKCKLIFEIRDILPLTFTADLGLSKFHPLVIIFSIFEKFGYKRSDMIVGTMPNLTEHVNKFRVTNKTEVVTIPFGIPSFWLAPKIIPDINLLNLNITANKMIIGYTGSLGSSNALFYISNLIKKLSTYKDILFVIIGGGSESK